MIAIAVVPFKAPNFARELMLRKLEAEVADLRRPRHVVDVMNDVLSAPSALAQIIRVSINPQPFWRP